MRPFTGCKMCWDLFDKYPYKNDEEMEGLMKKHFPDNVSRKNYPDGPL
jgi:hypothetical protein